MDTLISQDAPFSIWLVVVFVFVYAFHFKFDVLQALVVSIASRFQTPTAQQTELHALRKEITAMEVEAKSVNTPHTFSQWAKLNRKITQLQQQEAVLNEKIAAQNSKHLSIATKLRISEIFTLLIILYYAYGQSLATIPLGLRSFWFSNITPLPWCIICYIVIKRFSS